MKPIFDATKNGLVALTLASLALSGESAMGVEAADTAAPLSEPVTYQPPLLLCAPTYCGKPLPRLRCPLTGCCPSEDCRKPAVCLPRRSDGGCDQGSCDQHRRDWSAWFFPWSSLLP